MTCSMLPPPRGARSGSHPTPLSACPTRRRSWMGAALRSGTDPTVATMQSHATVLLVEDVARASAYYRDRLGFAVDSYDALPEHYAYARRDNCYVHFAHWGGVRRPPNRELVPP